MTQPSERKGQWFALCLLLVWTLMPISIASAYAHQIKINIPESDVDWPWKPQLDAAVPSSFFTGEVRLNDTDHWRVLSYVGAPLCVTAESSYDLMQLLELVKFMSADGTGMCPYYTTPYRVFYYWFHPEELALLYGEARWAALQRLQEPKVWSLVLTDAVGPTVRAAESIIAHMNDVDPPGQITVRMKRKPNELHTPLADFRVSVSVLLAGHPLEYHLSQLTVDGEAKARRRHIQYFLQAKEKASGQVAAFDAATAQVQQSLHDSLLELRREEQDAYDTHARFKEQYQRFLLERQSRRVVGESAENDSGTEGDSSVEDGRGSGDGAGKWKRKKTQPSALKVHVAASRMHTVAQRQAVPCQKITAAWATLCANGVRWEEDNRARQLRRLHERRNCPDELTPLQSVFDEREETTMVGELSPTARQRWVTSAAEMMAQREKVGRPPTLAQLYAVLFAVWKAEKAAAEASTVDAVAVDDAFPAPAFVAFVNNFVESGDAVAMAGGWLPRFVRAELHYMVGILDLVTDYQDDDDANNTAASPSDKNGAEGTQGRSNGNDAHHLRQYHDQKADAVARGVVHLYESLNTGSHHAAGALATLREHGIYMRQHPKAAMLLLLRSMKAAPSHLLRELLLSPLREADASTAAPSPLSSAEAHATPPRLAVDRLDASRLLRFEQFYAVDHTFHEVDDPFMTREGVTTLVAVSNENIHTADDAPELEDVYREAEVERKDEDFDTPITFRLSRRVLKASMLFSGFKGTRRDPREAQCELLVVLRQLGYFCDLNMRSVLSADRSGGGRRRVMETVIGVPLPDSCDEHETALYTVLGNTRQTILTCPGDTEATAGHGHPQLSVPTSETLFAMLHQVLLSLSYVHLLHTQQHELSHLYAALSLEMSLRLQELLVRRLGRLLRMGDTVLSATGEARHPSPEASSSTVPSAYTALLVLENGADEVAWAAGVLVDEVEDSTEGHEETPVTSSQERRGSRVVDRCRSVTDSPFVNTEALMLLALSRWAMRGPLVGDVVSAGDVERRMSQWTMEPFRLLARLLDPKAGVASSVSKRITEKSHTGKDESSAGRSADDDDDDELKELKPSKHISAKEAASRRRGRDAVHHTAEPLDVHALFLVCLAAMKRWKSDFPAVHLLDSTSYSVRRTDPFVLASFLLRAQDAATGAPLLSIAKLRDIALAATPHFLGTVPHFLPLVDDTVESYAARLLRFAARHIHALEPSTELLRSGSYGAGTPMDKSVSSGTNMGRRQGILDDAPPRRFRLRTLRRVKQQTMESADLQPLLYAADVHDYFNQSRWTFFGTALSAAYNALLYPFTFTTSENVLVEMESHLQLIAPEERAAVVRMFLLQNDEEDAVEGKTTAAGDGTGSSDERGEPSVSTSATSGAAKPSDMKDTEEETTSVSPFIDAFAKDAALREHNIACQLLSFTLESGMPEGFSLVFVEAADRGNPWLRRVADFLAEDVFGRWTASVWTEHHLSAQWQREKQDIAMDGSLLTINSRSPFRYAAVEGRQELFARVSRWRAAKAIAANASNVAAARDRLLWCTGLLTRRVYRTTGQVYPLAYEGSVFPAADLECVGELNALIAATAARSSDGTSWPVWSKAERLQAQRNGTALLHDLGDRLAYDYDLVETPPARRLPLSENDFLRNATDAEAAVALADRQDVHRERFARVSSQLVEPWNRRLREITTETLAYGEGTYYNSRLHRVSGYRWGATLQSWWLWLRNFFP